MRLRGKHGAAQRAFLPPHQEGAGDSHRGCAFRPFFLAETLKACALIGLHLLAAEGEAGSSGSQSPDFGDMWRHACPKSSEWDSDGGVWSESEGLSSSDFREHHVASFALHVIGQNWSGEKMFLLSGGLGTCEGGLELPRCPGCVVPGHAANVMAGGLLSQQGKPPSHRGRAVTAKERDVVREVGRRRGEPDQRNPSSLGQPETFPTKE